MLCKSESHFVSSPHQLASVHTNLFFGRLDFCFCNCNWNSWVRMLSDTKYPTLLDSKDRDIRAILCQGFKEWMVYIDKDARFWSEQKSLKRVSREERRNSNDFHRDFDGRWLRDNHLDVFWSTVVNLSILDGDFDLKVRVELIMLLWITSIPNNVWIPCLSLYHILQKSAPTLIVTSQYRDFFTSLCRERKQKVTDFPTEGDVHVTTCQKVECDTGFCSQSYKFDNFRLSKCRFWGTK
jgi:hypothetical protein